VSKIPQEPLGPDPASLSIIDPRRPVFDWQKTKRSLRGVLLITVFLCTLSWTASFLINPTVENSMPINPVSALWTLLLALFFVVFFPDPWTTLFAGLLVGGSLANIFERIVSPVNDYIPLPWLPYYYGNIADIAISIAPVFLILYIATLTVRRIQLRNQHPEWFQRW
jgi:hypothetical protein